MDEIVCHEAKLNELGIELPMLDAPAGSYIHGVASGNLLFLSGKGPISSSGKVGQEISVEKAKEDAYQIGLYLLAAIRKEIGSLNKVAKVIKLLGMVNSTPDFTEHPSVIDGCSDLFISIFGKQGEHARSSVGVNSLPGNMSIEIEAIIEIKQNVL